MSVGGIAIVAIVQLAALLAPLAIGLSGLISGGVAGLASIAAWALVGVPMSYGAVDVCHAIALSLKPRSGTTLARLIRT